VRRGGKLQAARYFIDCQLLAQAISDVTGKQTSVFPGLVGDHTNWSRMSVCTGEECQFRHRIRPNRGIAMSASRGYVLFAFHVSQHALGRSAIKASLIGLFHLPQFANPNQLFSSANLETTILRYHRSQYALFFHGRSYSGSCMPSCSLANLDFPQARLQLRCQEVSFLSGHVNGCTYLPLC
jgi:hypothetical protein